MYIQTKQLWKCNQYHRFPLLGLHNHCGQWLQPWNQKMIASSDGKKAMTNLDSVLKSRDITLPTKVHIVKAMVFPVVMYDCESWTIKKAEHQRIDAFELWCWRRLLKVPWTARRSINLKKSQPWIFTGRTDAEVEAPVFWCLMSTNNSLEKYLMLGKIECREKRASEDGCHHWCNEYELEQTVGDGEGQRGLACCSPWHHKELDTTGWPNNNIADSPCCTPESNTML